MSGPFGLVIRWASKSRHRVTGLLSLQTTTLLSQQNGSNAAIMFF